MTTTFLTGSCSCTIGVGAKNATTTHGCSRFRTVRTDTTIDTRGRIRTAQVCVCRTGWTFGTLRCSWTVRIRTSSALLAISGSHHIRRETNCTWCTHLCVLIALRIFTNGTLDTRGGLVHRTGGIGNTTVSFFAHGTRGGTGSIGITASWTGGTRWTSFEFSNFTGGARSALIFGPRLGSGTGGAFDTHVTKQIHASLARRCGFVFFFIGSIGFYLFVQIAMRRFK